MISLADAVIPRNEKVQPADFPELPFIGLDDIEAHTMHIIGTKSSNKMKSAAKRFYAGDVLYSRLRPYLNKVWRSDREGICSSEFIVLPGNEYIEPTFLALRLNSSDFVAYANSLNAGDRPRVNFDQISSFLLPPFSLAQQRAIVAKIEQLFSELDNGIANLKTAKDKLEIYRQAVLKKAFEGELTKEWRENQADLPSADELLKQIKKERQKHYEKQLQEWEQAVAEWETNGKGGKKPSKPKKLKASVKIAANELRLLPPNAKSWKYVRLAQVATIGSGMSVSKNRKLQNPIEVAYLRVANVQRGNLVLDEIKHMNIERSNLLKLELKKWDILFNEGGDRDKLGRGWIWESQIEPCITQNHVFRATAFIPTETFAKFISHWGNTFGRDYFEKTGKQTTNLASINKTVLSNFPVPITSYQEQNQIIQEIETRLSVCDNAIKNIDEALEKSEALRQSILKKAFEGKLLSDAELQACREEADWEPAEKLLQRIKGEKKR